LRAIGAIMHNLLKILLIELSALKLLQSAMILHVRKSGRKNLLILINHVVINTVEFGTVLVFGIKARTTPRFQVGRRKQRGRQKS
jgi:hypothetical protein